MTRMTLQSFTDWEYETLPHLPNSSDHSLTNYGYFKHIDTFLSPQNSVLKKQKLHLKISWHHNSEIFTLHASINLFVDKKKEVPVV